MRRLFSVFLAASLAASQVSGQEISFDAGTDDEALSDLLRSAALTLSLGDEGEPAAQDYVAAARADYRRLLTALYADGYYSGIISITVNGQEAATIAPLDAPRTIDRIAISVTPGARFAFGATTISPVPQGTEFSENFQTGEPAKADVIRQNVNTAITSWRDAGYAKAATASQQIVARHDAERLDVTVAIAPGAQLRFGPLTVTGNQDVRTDRILAIAGLPTGEVFSPAALTAAERRLRDSGAFDSVSLVEAEGTGPGDTLPITAQVTEALPRRFGFGIEVSSLEGLAVSSFWLHRNYFGGAERLRVEGAVEGIAGQTGGIDYSLGASLGIPAVYGPETDFLLSATISREDEPDFLLDQAAVEATLTRLIREDLEVSGGFGLLTAREVNDAGERDYTLLTAPLSATLERRDVPTDAKSGYFINIDATPFVSIVGADNGARVFSDARGYYSFGADDRFTLAARSQIGSVFGASLADAPPDFLFFSGGGGTVRGQSYNALGVDTTIDGEIVRRGGLSFAGAQLEARVDVTDSIGVVGFYDVGFVGNTTNPFDDGDWHAGAGLGIRYKTGIGPIRLDIGTPTTGDRAGERVEVYIGIGQSF